MAAMAANAADPDQRQLALDYLTTSRVEDLINSSMNEYDEQLFKDATPEKRAEFRKFLKDAIGWDALKEQLIDLVLTLYTKEELEASIAYMRSPAGASMTAKGPEFSKRYASIGLSNLQKVIKDCCSQTK